VNARRLLYRHERKLIAAWFGAGALLLGLIAVWGVGLRGAERVVEAWHGRWDARVAHAEELVAAGRYEEAAAYLEQLDAAHPALFVKHARDRERERVLELLGRSHLTLGHKRRALEALERLADFDPRNWSNHFRLGEAQLLLDEPAAARDSFERVLAIHPNHRPTVLALIGMAHDGGRYADVPPLFEAYLDAWLLARMRLSLGEHERVLEVPVDGREHTLELPIDVPSGWSGELCLATAGYSVRLETVELTGPLVTGSTAPATALRVPGSAPWEPRTLAPGPAGAWSAAGMDSALCVRGLKPTAVSRVRVTLTAYKGLPPDLWEQVERSYRNTLDVEGLESVRERTVIGGRLEAGSLYVD
jgi:hypothetical protein